MDNFDILLMLFLLRAKSHDPEKILDVAHDISFGEVSASRHFGKELVRRNVLTSEQLRECLADVGGMLRERKWNESHAIAEWIVSLEPEIRRQVWKRLPTLPWHVDTESDSAPLQDEVPFARGGLGQIWKVRESPTGRTVLVKQLRPDLADDGDLLERFVTEGRVTAQLEHPNIVPVYRVAEHTNEIPPYYVMRWIQGKTLDDEVKEFHTAELSSSERRQRWRTLVQRMVSVCEAVAYAHARGVLHRDIKPSNIIVGEFGETHLLDWGLAKVVDDPDDPSSVAISGDGAGHETLAGTQLGSPLWMAPEQARGDIANIDQRSDVYGLGATLFTVLTGESPHKLGQQKTIKEVMDAILNEPTPIATQVFPDTPPGLAAICVKAMQKEPDKRYASVKELIADLEHWLSNEPISAYREPILHRLARYAITHPTRSAIVAGLSQAAFVGIIVVVSILIVVTLQLRAVTRRLLDARAGIQRQTVKHQLDDMQDDLEFVRTSRRVGDLLNRPTTEGKPSSQDAPLIVFLLSHPEYKQTILLKRAPDGELSAPWVFERENDRPVLKRNGKVSPDDPWLACYRQLETGSGKEPVLCTSVVKGPGDTKTVRTFAMAAVSEANRVIGFIALEVDLGKMLEFDLGIHPYSSLAFTDAEGNVIFWQTTDVFTVSESDDLLKRGGTFSSTSAGGASSPRSYWDPWGGVLVQRDPMPYEFGSTSGQFNLITIVDLDETNAIDYVVQPLVIAMLLGVLIVLLVSFVIWKLLRSMLT